MDQVWKEIKWIKLIIGMFLNKPQIGKFSIGNILILEIFRLAYFIIFLLKVYGI